MTDYLIRENFENMDVMAIHGFLSHDSYWARGIPLETVEASLKNSFCFGVFYAGTQVAFTRLVTDHATFAYLSDVYVLHAHRGKGLSKMLMEHLMGLDWTKGLRRMLLATMDAHGLYYLFGFEAPSNPE